MKQFFITVAGVFAAMLLFFIGLPLLLIISAAGSSKPSVPSASVLVLDLRESLSDQDSNDPFAAFSGGGLSVMKVVTTLRAAEKDDKVKALMVRLPEGGLSPAAAEEIRDAVLSFRKAGKYVMAHSQGLYQSGSVVSTYMVGSAASEFWMQPHSSFQVTGLATSDLFLKRAFDKYGVSPQFEQRNQYKNAVNPYLHSDYTPAHREATLGWMGSIFDNAVAAAAKDRKMDAAALKALLVAGPYSAEDALKKGLISHLGHVEAVKNAALKKGGDKAELVELADYATARSGPAKGKATIAVIGGEGAIITGQGSSDPFRGGEMIYSDVTAQAFYDAIEDKDVKAIVFRVSSPGGSDVASEQILVALQAAKAAGKPVVVSMGSYAASGGYWISSDASAIVAHPSTLTGSIGVYSGKFAVTDALGRFGLDARDLSVGGPFAEAYTSAGGFSPAQRAAIASWTDGIYEAFVTRVANGRKLTREQVMTLANGRVWTGAQAKSLGLVDELGGFYTAVDKAKALAKIDAKSETRLKYMRNNKSPFAAFAEAFGGAETLVRGLHALGVMAQSPQGAQVVRTAERMQLEASGSAAVLAPVPTL